MAKILLVDDDAAVLLTLSAILLDHGHVVESATTNAGAHALAQRGGFDLVISDAVLRGDNGDDLATWATDLGMPLLLMSGEPGRIERLRQGPTPFLAKPFRTDALIAAVDAVLADRAR